MARIPPIALRIAGDICSQFFDASGSPVTTYISGKTLAIPLTALRQACWTIGVAHGEGKINAILGAARGDYLNALITTQETAEALLRQLRPAFD